MPQFQLIANELRKKIVSGSYPKNSRLPTQTQLAKDFNTSRMTIQRALNLLQIEGIVEGRQGAGSFVKGPESVYDYDFKVFGGMTKKLGHLGKLTNKIISFDVSFPSEKEQEKLKIKKNEPVYDIVRLRVFNDEPLALEYTIMPVLLIPGVTEDVLKGSIYAFINQSLNLNLGISHRRIKADRADFYDQTHLECQAIDPILEIEQTVYLENGKPFEYSQTRHRFDKGDITIINNDTKHIYNL